MRLSLIVSAATLALVCGCGGSSNDPNNPSGQQNAYGQYTPPANTGTAPTGAYTAPTTTGTAPTNPTPGSGAAAGSPATPIAVPAAAAVEPLLKQLASGEVAAGMQPEGSPFAGNFQEGQVLEQQLTIQAGKCYTVVGASMGIQELDIQLVLVPSPLPPQVLAQDQSQGGTAVLGGKAAGCFKNALPFGGPGKVVIKATRGAGLGIAQIYSK
jgi:hypothetical protein